VGALASTCAHRLPAKAISLVVLAYPLIFNNAGSGLGFHVRTHEDHESMMNCVKGVSFSSRSGRPQRRQVAKMVVRSPLWHLKYSASGLPAGCAASGGALQRALLGGGGQ